MELPGKLSNGDVVHLINPDMMRVGTVKLSEEDFLDNSFAVLLDLPTPKPQQAVFSHLTNSLHHAAAQDNQNATGGTFGRSNTVIRLLNQSRNIQDFYEFRELLGSGAAGQVYRGIKKDTGN